MLNKFNPTFSSFKSWRHRVTAIGIVALSWGALSGTALSAEWTPRVWNPKPADGDVVIDLPCDGKLVFRAVQTVVMDENSASAPLSDSPVSLGATEGERAYMEYRREEHISGALTNERGNFFLMGKYEISHAQYQAVMADSPEKCPTRMGPPDALPETGISWYDAVEFTRRLNAWLYKDDLAQLTAIGAQNGYVRLPTEVEWEFATRGGLSVSAAERSNSRFFTNGSIDDYAWYNGAQSASGKAKPIGQKNPNPLGLYDLYGNAEEIMLDPFRLTRLDRLHGAVGGFVVRGGSFLDNPETLTSSRRDEYPFFSQDSKGEMRRRTAGFRLVISTPSIGDLASVERLEAAFKELSKQVEGDAANQPSMQLQEIEARIEGPLKTEIAGLRTRLETEFTRRNDVENRSLRRAIFNAGMSARELHLASRALDNFYANLNDPDFPADLKESTRTRFKRERENFDMFVTIYTDSIVQIATDQGNKVAVQGDIVKRELTEQKRQALVRYVDEAMQQISDYHAGSVTQTRAIVDKLIGAHPWFD
ncbi:formylglycine-generating enzyme family protein [Bartonella sp. HY761]|uniref:formylglycine-generating enzyme family protein n=1 Tax=Bartonella sp. HY761 TaxID=2979330 RepID=UPI0022066001|nr:SUMF1/EgtB/PvdO family nonheme iron enzyme [Bartonella sp. HY761]UXN05864.1 formylglycine-generating enzyme family protein [Bartonella sp. HY761]